MVKLHKIYTKTGDDGTTGLLGAVRLSKDHLRICAIGDVDEANSSLGVAICEAEREISTALQHIQHDLFDLGADLAQTNDATVSQKQLRITELQILWLEQEMDKMIAVLAPLTSFILPGGSRLSASLHMARTIVRRAERSVVMLASDVHAHQEAALQNPLALQYLNRLSDYLFVMARYCNAKGAKDILWAPGKNQG